MGLFSKTTEIAEFNFEGHKIKVENWYRLLPMKSEASLSVDGKRIASSTKWSHFNPDVPVFQVQNISEHLQSIDVFVIGAFKIKFAVNINGETAYRDEISAADALQKKYLGNGLAE